MILKEFVILAKAGIQCFQCFLDHPVKPEDDKLGVDNRLCTVEAYHAIVDKNEDGKVRYGYAGAGSTAERSG